jgi:nucleotide-binding universal stress UspA family protein
MKTILVPTDFSEYALYALKTAAIIAKKMYAQIRLVHTFDLSSKEAQEDAQFKDFYDQLSAAKKEQLDALSNMDFLKGITVNVHFEPNMKPWEMVTKDKYKNADLIVIGSNGKSGSRDLFIGSNAEKIIRMASAPVLTVKKEDEFFDIRKIVFASDFHDDSYTVFKKIKFFIDFYKAQVNLLKVITPRYFETTNTSTGLMNDFAKKFNLTNFTINTWNDSNIEDGILNFSNRQKTDLIAIETHGKSGVNHIIGGNLAENIADDAQLPVLTIKIEEEKDHKKGQRQPTDYENWGAE